MTALWKNRKLSPEEQIAMDAGLSQGDEGSVSAHGRVEEPEVVVEEEEVTLTEIYAREIPFSVSETIISSEVCLFCFVT